MIIYGCKVEMGNGRGERLMMMTLEDLVLENGGTKMCKYDVYGTDGTWIGKLDRVFDVDPYRVVDEVDDETRRVFVRIFEGLGDLPDEMKLWGDELARGGTLR